MDTPPVPAEKTVMEANTDEPDTEKSTSFSFSDIQVLLNRFLAWWQEYRWWVGGGVGAILYQYPSLLIFMLKPLYQSIVSIIAIGVGIGLGLGWATHVHDQLDQRTASQTTTTAPQNSGAPPLPSPQRQSRQISSLEDDQSYASLLKAAGYFPLQVLRRGQVVRTVPTPHYTFDATQPQAMLQQLWPTLPNCINRQLGVFIDYVVRDFVATWYSTLDPISMPYPNTGSKKKDDDGDSTTDDDATNNKNENQQNFRTCLSTTGPYQKQPFFEHLYMHMSILFGNLATRVEHVNVFEVILIKWVRILAHSFQTYRQLRTNSNTNMTREFLLANKLHKAVTMGLDIPALLFADLDGRECGVDGKSPDEILQERLEQISECELDYHRTLAHRMVRALLVRHEFESVLLSSLLTELLAGSVLVPIYSCFTPDYINGWIVAGLSGSKNDEEEENTQETTTEEGTPTATIPANNGEGSSSSSSGQDEIAEVTGEPSLVTESPPEPRKVAPPLQEDIVTQLAKVLIDLQGYIDLEDLRNGQSGDWDQCQSTVMRLVLIVEAALQDGRCRYPMQDAEIDLDNEDDSDRPVEVTLDEFEATTFTRLLMELTSDVDAFEERFAKTVDGERYSDDRAQAYAPDATEQSTLRTLIAAWLHNGRAHGAISALVGGNVLAPYYHSKAFLRGPSAQAFCRQLRALEDVPIVVDTTTVLASPRLCDVPALQSTTTPRARPHTRVVARANPLAASAVSPINTYSSSIPRHSNFHRNEAFASSLRSERDRRRHSWQNLMAQEEASEEGLPVVVCNRLGEEHAAWHRELHHVAKVFYSGTNMVSIRDATRKSEDDTATVSLLTVEMTSGRRRIEVPDDDSSFLLRAQPRSLNPVGVHRDSRNHDLSFRSFAGTYQEPVSTDSSADGRYIRRCLIRYFPIDRTAAVAIQNDVRLLDQRKTKGAVPDTITLGTPSRSAPYLSADFLRDRHLCQRWTPKGTNRTQSLLASSVMESTDFTSMPRSGRAIDFLYRMSFFERPMVDLGGMHFSIHDSGAFSAHRADASSLEISDASLSATLLAIGAEAGNISSSGESALRSQVEMGKDGYPVLWMKFHRKQEESQVEVKPYRVSFVRAALMMTSARHEAQLQSLTKCIQAGSAKKATKAVTDAHLRPALKLLEYAGSSSRDKQSLVLRDLKLGVNHIDRTQLRRNGLLLPRFPTRILEMSATVEDAIDASEVGGVDLFGAVGLLYKIRVFIKGDLVADESDIDGVEGYYGDNGQLGKAFQEEWVVYRTFKEFQAIHKHLKNQVSPTESSGTAGSRLVGAASAAFTTTGMNLTNRTRTRKVLIPSMAQAAKIGALGITKKSVDKRKECLQDYLQYILSPGHLLSRCTEIMLFLGAFYPLLPEVSAGQIYSGLPDPLGRTEMLRTVLEDEPVPEVDQQPNSNGGDDVAAQNRSRAQSQVSEDAMDDDGLDDDEEQNSSGKRIRKIDMIPAIRNKIDKVPLSQVRNRIFELLKYQFGFENASFARNRLLAALKTASFAVTSGSEFRRTLYKLHTTQLSADAMAGWIKYVTDMLWPNGVFFESSPPMTDEALEEQSNAARDALHESFPEAVKAILGQELAHDGMEIFHEMLQNRLIVKSMCYMLLDHVWLEIFPEIGDILQCGGALDIDP